MDDLQELADGADARLDAASKRDVIADARDLAALRGGCCVAGREKAPGCGATGRGSSW